jgi:hypothetical protein
VGQVSNLRAAFQAALPKLRPRMIMSPMQHQDKERDGPKAVPALFSMKL